jgi:glycosyltransferase involved in cell wall biosynthesis
VDAIVGLLKDPDRAAALGLAGRRTVLSHYTWDLKAAELERQLRDVACRTGRVPHA